MIEFFQPIGLASPVIDGWQFVPMPGFPTATASLGATLDGGPSAGYVWPLLDVPPAEHVGHRVQNYGTDLYDRIHISIVELDLGNVISLQERAFTIWNAWFAYRELVEVSSVGSGGITIVGLPDVPAPFPVFRHGNYTVVIDTDGPPTIDATFTFTFASGEILILHLVGRRVIVFPFPPNWSSPLAETLEWKTDVMRMHDGGEQRRALRVIPRRGFEYNMLLQGRDTDRLETILWGWSTRDFVLPVWSDATRTQTTIATGATTIPIDTTTRSFNESDYVVLYFSSTDYEAAQIETLADDGITVVSPLQRTWPIGTKVFPAVIAHVSATVATQRHTGRVQTGRAIFMCNPDKTYPYLPDSEPAVTYDGLEVVTIPLNWKQAINNDFTRELMVADAGTGPISYFQKDNFSRIVRPFEWLLRSRADIVAFRGFIARRRGQAKTCWIPSWHGDFTVVGTTGPSSSSLVVDGTEFAALVGVDTARDRIRVRMKDGSVFYRKIESVTELDDTSMLGLDSAFGVTVDPDTVFAVDFLLRCRLATDKVEIPWVTDGIATPTLSFTTVKE